MSKRPLLSVIIPMYNEQEVIAETHRRLTAAIAGVESCEIIYVDDGSHDATEGIVRSLMASDERIRLICFSRNFGHQNAVSAGLARACGETVVIIDADLQDPPEIIPEMLRMWREDGCDVVYGQRTRRQGDSFFKKATAFAFYRLLRTLSGVDIPADTGDFRLIDRKVADVLNAMPEHNRFLRGMVPWVGFKQAPILFERADRWAGSTKYPLGKMLKLALNGIIGFSWLPLEFPFALGCLLAVLGGAALFGLLIAMLCGSGAASGWWLASLMVFLSGLILFCMGLQGRYIGQIADDARHRPNYIIRSADGFPDPE